MEDYAYKCSVSASVRPSDPSALLALLVLFLHLYSWSRVLLSWNALRHQWSPHCGVISECPSLPTFFKSKSPKSFIIPRVSKSQSSGWNIDCRDRGLDASEAAAPYGSEPLVPTQPPSCQWTRTALCCNIYGRRNSDHCTKNNEKHIETTKTFSGDSCNFIAGTTSVSLRNRKLWQKTRQRWAKMIKMIKYVRDKYIYTQKVSLEGLISRWMSVRDLIGQIFSTISTPSSLSNWAPHTSVSSSAKSSSDHKFKWCQWVIGITGTHSSSDRDGSSEQACSGMSKQHRETNVGLCVELCNIPVSGQYMICWSLFIS